MFKIEIRKALKNKLFLATLAIASAIALYAAVSVINLYNESIEMNKFSENQIGDINNPDLAMYTLFNSWISEEWSSSGQSLFFLMLPFFSSLAYSWSLCSEIKSGYIKHIVTRINRKKYFMSKFFAVFISGGIVIVIPMLLNFMLVSSFIPAIKPDIFYDMYYANSNTTQAFSILFFEHPFLFVGYRFLSAFIYSGLFAVLGMTVAFFVRNKFIVVAFPFLFSLTLSYISSYHFLPFVFSPVHFLHGGGEAYRTSAAVIICEAMALFLVTFITVRIKGEKDDIF